MHPSDDRFGNQSRDEMLERVRRRGHLLRRRTAALRVTGVAAALLLVIGAAVLPGRGESEIRVATDTPPTTTTTAATPGPADADEDDAGPGEQEAPATGADAGAAPTTTTTVAPTSTTTTALVCRNSTNPECGAFYWDPPPGPNEPMTMEVVSVRDAEGNEYLDGERADVPEDVEVTIEIRARDDGPIAESNVQVDYGDGSHDGAGYMCDVGMTPAYGPWDPPEPANSVVTVEFVHTYEEARTFTLEASYRAQECGNPYESDGQTSIEIEAHAPSSSSSLPV